MMLAKLGLAIIFGVVLLCGFMAGLNSHGLFRFACWAATVGTAFLVIGLTMDSRGTK